MFVLDLALQTAGNTFPEKLNMFFFSPKFSRRSVVEKRCRLFPERFTYIPFKKKRPIVKGRMNRSKFSRGPDHGYPCPILKAKYSGFWLLTELWSIHPTLADIFFTIGLFFLEGMYVNRSGKNRERFSITHLFKNFGEKKTYSIFPGTLYPAYWRARSLGVFLFFLIFFL